MSNAFSLHREETIIINDNEQRPQEPIIIEIPDDDNKNHEDGDSQENPIVVLDDDEDDDGLPTYEEVCALDLHKENGAASTQEEDLRQQLAMVEAGIVEFQNLNESVRRTLLQEVQTLLPLCDDLTESVNMVNRHPSKHQDRQKRRHEDDDESDSYGYTEPQSRKSRRVSHRTPYDENEPFLGTFFEGLTYIPKPGNKLVRIEDPFAVGVESYYCVERPIDMTRELDPSEERYV
jgi:hypothetical protein